MSKKRTSTRGNKSQTQVFSPISLVNHQANKEKHKVILKGAQAPAMLAITFWSSHPRRSPMTMLLRACFAWKRNSCLPSADPPLQVQKHQEEKGSLSPPNECLQAALGPGCQDLAKGIGTHGVLCTRCPHPSEIERRRNQTKAILTS